jgi:hypothetical protein
LLALCDSWSTTKGTCAFRSLQEVPSFDISGSLSKKIWIVTWCVSSSLNLVWLLQDSSISFNNI